MPGGGCAEGSGRCDQAIEWHVRAGEADDADSLRRAAELLRRMGQVDEALTWCRRTGHVFALHSAIELLCRAGRVGRSPGV